MSDPAKYRSREEVSKVRKERDPIEQVRTRLIEGEHADDAALKGIDKEIKAVVNEAAEYAQNSPEPDEAALFRDAILQS